MVYGGKGCLVGHWPRKFHGVLVYPWITSRPGVSLFGTIGEREYD